jgi:hypothetical protein
MSEKSERRIAADVEAALYKARVISKTPAVRAHLLELEKKYIPDGRVEVISVEATREAIYVVIRTTTVLQLDVNDGVRKIFSEQSSSGENSQPGNALVKYSSDWRAAWNLSERAFRNWRSAGIIPDPDGNVLGRDIWKPETFAKTNAELLLSGKHSRIRKPPHLRPKAEPLSPDPVSR